MTSGSAVGEAGSGAELPTPACSCACESTGRWRRGGRGCYPDNVRAAQSNRGRKAHRVLLAGHDERLARLGPVAASLGQDTEDVPSDMAGNVLPNSSAGHFLRLLSLGLRRSRGGEGERRVEGQRLEGDGFCRQLEFRDACSSPPWLGSFFRMVSAALRPFLYCLSS